jgi:phage-Barnase-EndoU-ColicinE5/D-RelE like nuclease3/Phage Mu protein F like protein
MPTEDQISAELDGLRQQFQEQIDFFRAKLNLPTERWDDIKTRANDKAFYVAGAQKADLLNDLRQAVDKTITGGSIGQFRKDFAEAVRKSGWAGWAGQGTKAGEAWRTRVIYQTNIATSYAAGRWAQLNDPDLARVRPFWQYIHSDSVLSPRPLHKAWGDSNLTLPKDHPFWRTHFPPNGWGCQCRIKAVRSPTADDATTPPEGWDTIDPKTGAPVGIDKGWDYAPGANTDASLRSLVQDKLITHPKAIGKALTVDINRYINTKDQASAYAARALLGGAVNESPLWLGFVDDAKRVSAVAGADVNGYFITLPSDAVRHVQGSHGTDGKGQRPATPSDYEKITTVLNEADAIRAGVTTDHKNKTVVSIKTIDGEQYRAVFEVLPGKKNRALALLSLVIKTKK